MLDNTLSITYKTATVVLTRILEGGYASEYRGEHGDDKLLFTVKHTMPKARGGSGESHMARLDVERYDSATGNLLRIPSAWRVFKTFEGSQNTSDLEAVADALDSFLDSALMSKIVGGES